MREIIPKTIAAGINFSAEGFLPVIGGVAWSVVLHLRGPNSYDLPATADSGRQYWSVPGATTKDWAPGVYAYTVRATNGPDVIEIETGRVTITPDLTAVANGADMRSDWRKGLDAIDAVIGKRATLDQERYRINNRELYRTPIADLLKLRAFYQQKVNEESGCGRSRFRDLRVRMRPIGR